MSNQHAAGGTDTGAAFLGLIGGAIFVGAILYGIVVLTNRHFANEAAEGGKGGAEKTSLVASTSSRRLA